MTSEIKPEDVKLPEPVIKLTPEGMRDFIGANFDSLEYGREDQQPDEGDRFLLSSHDLLSAFCWWDYPVFTADQVRAAVLEAKAQEREACAQVAESRADGLDASRDACLYAVASAIRSGK